MTRIIEGGGTVSAPKNGTIPVRIIVEGTGSTGVYSADVLKNSASVFENRPMFLSHPDDPNRPDLRKITEAVAKTGKVTVGETQDGRTALFTDAKIRSEYAGFLEEFSDVFGVSIYASALGDTNDDGKVVVESFDGTDPYVSVDFVVAPGREGRFGARAMESLAAIQTSLTEGKNGTPSGVTENNNTEVSPVELKDIAEAVGKLQESFDALTASLAPVVESLKPAPKPEVEPDVAGAVEAAIEAGLPKSFRASVVESVKAGNDIKEAVAAQAKVVEELRKELAPVEEAGAPLGYVTHESKLSADEFTVGAWK